MGPQLYIHLGRAILISPQLEEFLRILPSNLQPIRIRNLHIIEPVTRILKRLKGIVDTEQNPIRSNLRHTKIQRRGAEMPRRRDPNVLRKVLPNRLLARLPQPQQLLPVFKPVIDPPHVEGDVFAEMSDDDLQFGVTIKDAVRDHAERVQGHAMRKRERGSDKPFSIGPELVVDGAGGVARMEVQRYVQLGAGLPEDIPFLIVVEDHIVAVGAGALCVVDESAEESVLGDAATELICGFLGVVHGQGPVINKENKLAPFSALSTSLPHIPLDIWTR